MEKLLNDIILSSKIEIISRTDGNPKITKIAFDSRDVEDGTLFFALPGTHTTGNVFIQSAIENGAKAVVYEGDFDVSTVKSDIPLLKVESARKAMAPVSASFYDNPSKKLGIIGVTGTEGKSSTVSFIWQLLRLTGHKAGFISTVQYSLGGEAEANPQHTTTPEAPIIQNYLHEMVENGCEYAVIETSSHGLSPKLNRTGNIDFDCGIFMNVTLEHLEFHGTFEQYRDDKANLFRKLDECSHEKTILGKKVTVPSFGIVNLEDESADYFIHATGSERGIFHQGDEKMRSRIHDGRQGGKICGGRNGSKAAAENPGFNSGASRTQHRFCTFRTYVRHDGAECNRRARKADSAKSHSCKVVASWRIQHIQLDGIDCGSLAPHGNRHRNSFLIREGTHAGERPHDRNRRGTAVRAYR